MAPRVCLTPRLSGVGGMVSFQGRLAEGLTSRGIEVTYDLADRPLDAVLVVGGTRDFGGLQRARKDGIPVVQRLNGMNWIHRRRYTGLRHFLRAEYGNLVLRLIRSHFASQIVYQSIFARGWWERVYGPTRIPNRVVYNGVPLKTYHPKGAQDRPIGLQRVLMVEGNLGGGYELGLEWGVSLAERLANQGIQLELVVAGKVSKQIKSGWQGKTAVNLHFTGLVPAADIPKLDRSAHLLFAADLNAACPNSVIEALACGLPVVSFDTGALNELVQGDAGRIVPYGGDPWRLDPPDLESLTLAAVDVLGDNERYRSGARHRAEEVFDLDRMVVGYLQALDISVPKG